MGVTNRLDRQQGQYLIAIEGTDDEISRAETILKTQGVENWTIFNPV